MLVPPGPIRVLVATKPVDFRKGMNGLAALVKDRLSADPFSGVIYVFRSKRSLRSATMVPIIYILQYLLGLAIVTLCVERLGLRSQLAPIPASLVTVPLTFVLTRKVFSSRVPSADQEGMSA